MGKKTDKTVFITDDDSDDREFLLEALKKIGYQGNTVLFDHGEQLLEHLSEHAAETPDLILLDLNMPIKDGYETLKELKSGPQVKSIPVMILTSSTRKEDEGICHRLGCDYFQRKPITLQEYKELAELIDRYSG
jgi:CheY-like chemotaxis protein